MLFAREIQYIARKVYKWYFPLCLHVRILEYRFHNKKAMALREKRQTLLVEDASLSGENERINELIEFIRNNKYCTLRYDDTLVRKIIQNVTVYEDHFVICFKSGIEIEV